MGVEKKCWNKLRYTYPSLLQNIRQTKRNYDRPKQMVACNSGSSIPDVARRSVRMERILRSPLSKEFGWTLSQVAFTFTISWFFLGVAAVGGGLWLNRTTPRVVAMTGGCLWGTGVFLASFAQHRLWWLYLTYGVIGGTGLGMGYIVPISFLVKWFPDRRGLIVGIAVGGFGAGSLISAPLAHPLIQHVGVSRTFSYLGIAYLAVAILSAYFMKNPEAGWKPLGWLPTAKQVAQRADRNFTLGEALRSWQ